MDGDGVGTRRVMLRGIIIVVLAALSVIGLVNPLPSLIMRAAPIAQPEVDTAVSLLSLPASEWCLTGDFQDWDPDSHKMSLADEGIYATSYTFAEPGRYEWKVVSCGDWEHAFPQENAWVHVTKPNQTIAFSLDTNVTGNDFFPFRFAVHAEDEIASFTAVGNFQDWENDNPKTQLQLLADGQYRLIYQIPEPGTYRGNIVATGTWDGFLSDGRSNSHDRFEFQTTKPDQYALFLLDTNTDRSSIRYGIHPMLIWLAYDGGMRLLSLIFGAVALAFLGNILWNWRFYAPHRWLDAGCPQCGQHTLRRIRRQWHDRVLGWFGMPIKRYVCTSCRWTGQRIDDQDF